MSIVLSINSSDSVMIQVAIIVDMAITMIIVRIVLIGTMVAIVMFENGHIIILVAIMPTNGK